MKSFVFISLVIFLQLFLAVESRAVDKKEVSVIYTFGEELEKYKKLEKLEKEKRWDFEIENEISENNIFKRMALEDEKDFEATLKELEDYEDYEDEVPVVDEVPVEFPHKDFKLSKRGTVSSDSYFRSQLSAFETEIYDHIRSISNPSKIKKLTVEVPNLKKYGVKSNYEKYAARSVGALIRDHPEFWWIKRYKMNAKKDGKYIDKITITIISDYSISKINTYKVVIKNKAVTIAKEAAKKNSTYNRLLFIHNYLAKYIKYKDQQTYSYNLYGALYMQASACEGYAESFTYIARLINVPTICVTSSSHKWNYVRLNTKWYAVDVTFDDPSINGKIYSVGDSKNVKDKFFLVGKNTIVQNKKTYTTYSNRKLVSYLEFKKATGFKFPTLSDTQYPRPSSSTSAKKTTSKTSKSSKKN